MRRRAVFVARSPECPSCTDRAVRDRREVGLSRECLLASERNPAGCATADAGLAAVLRCCRHRKAVQTRLADYSPSGAATLATAKRLYCETRMSILRRNSSLHARCRAPAKVA